MRLTQEELTQLHNWLNRHFSPEQIEHLCELTEFDVMPTSGESKSGRIVDLIQWHNRRETVHRLAHACQSLAPALSFPVALAGINAGDSPYLGMQFYDVKDARRFYGRDTLIVQALNQLREYPTLMVVGESGSGKSSLARAGVIATLQGIRPHGNAIDLPVASPNWQYIIVKVHESEPLQQLAAAVTVQDTYDAAEALGKHMRQSPTALLTYVHRMLQQSNKEHAVLLIDQFEQLFVRDDAAIEPDEDVETYIANLLALGQPGGPAHVVLTLRTDFYHFCAQNDQLRDLHTHHHIYVKAMTRTELSECVQNPADTMAVGFDTGLVETIVNDASGQPGALPLVSFALDEMWHQMQPEQPKLTWALYHSVAGVKGAIANKAERFYQKSSPEQQQIIRTVFQGLTRVNRDGPDTRRQRVMSEWLATDDGDLRHVIDQLGDERLLVLGDDRVELAHEAIIREWKRLNDWLDEDREGLRQAQDIEDAAASWQASGYNAEYLTLAGAPLQIALAWIQNPNHAQDENTKRFVAACAAKRKAEEQEKERLVTSEKLLLQHQVSTARRNVRLLSVFVAFLVVFSGIVAYYYQTAQQAATKAEIQSLISESGRLESLAPDRSALLAIGAFKLSTSLNNVQATDAAREQLLRIFSQNHQMMAYYRHAGKSMPLGLIDEQVIASSDNSGELAIIGYGNNFTGVFTQSFSTQLKRHQLAFLPQSNSVIALDRKHNGELFQIKLEPKLETSISKPVAQFAGTTQLEVTSDGSHIVLVRQNMLSLVSTDTWKEVSSWRFSGRPIEQAAISASGQFVAILEIRHDADTSQTITIGDINAPASMSLRCCESGNAKSIAISNDGIVSVFVHHADKFEVYQSKKTFKDLAPNIDSLALIGSSAAQQYTVSPLGTVVFWQLGDNKIELVRQTRPPLQLSALTNLQAKCLAISPSETTIAVCDHNRIQLFSAENGSHTGFLVGHTGDTNYVMYQSDQVIFSGGDDGTIRRWRVTPNGSISAASASDTHLAFGNSNGEVFITRLHNDLFSTQVVSDPLAAPAVIKLSRPIKALAINSQERLLAVVSEEPPVYILDIDSGKLKYTLEGIVPSDNPTSLSFAKTTAALALATDTGNLYLWRLSSASYPSVQPTKTFSLPEQAVVRSVSLSADAELLAASGDSGIGLWQTSKGSYTQVYSLENTDLSSTFVEIVQGPSKLVALVLSKEVNQDRLVEWQLTAVGNAVKPIERVLAEVSRKIEPPIRHIDSDSTYFALGTDHRIHSLKLDGSQAKVIASIPAGDDTVYHPFAVGDKSAIAIFDSANGPYIAMYDYDMIGTQLCKSIGRKLLAKEIEGLSMSSQQVLRNVCGDS